MRATLWMCLSLATLAGCHFDDELERLPPTPDAAPATPDAAPGCTDGLTEPCAIAACTGTRRCVGGVFGDCVPPPERCDGADDDCDGTVDEGFAGLGETCSAGEGACARDGVQVCDAAGAGVVCDAVAGDAMAEACDGIDDDCDGTVDEGFAGLGEACSAGEGACARYGVQVCDAAGAGVICDAVAGDAMAEVCDGVDDDCDGAVDEGVEADAPCETGEVGACADGLTACVDGATVCLGVTAASDEVCDGIDNDCDGAVDEGEAGAPLARDCYDGPEGTAGVGPCVGGVQRCGDGAFGACEGQVLPSPERCDDADSDCNGVVDDIAAGACVCRPGEERLCYTGPAGTEGVGVCRGGTQTCAADRTAFGPCTGDVVPTAEQCDGLDDDCDGGVDEDDAGGALAEPCYEGPPGTEGVAACAAGQRVCVGGVFAACEGQVTPQEEVCSLRDDDCDGDNQDYVCSFCEEVRLLDPTAVDGEYPFDVDGDPAQPASIYCHDMAGEPREFLTLVNTGPGHNFSQYTAGGQAPGVDVHTRFERVRLDVDTLVIDGADHTFATSVGGLRHSGNLVTGMPFAVAMACGNNAVVGVGNVDLRGTPFAAVGQACIAGFRAFGSAVFSEEDQLVNLTGGGFCGWGSVAPNCNLEPQYGGRGYILQLRYVEL